METENLESAKKRKGKKIHILVGGGIGLILCLFALIFAVDRYFYITTDDAYVQAYTTMVSARVNGYIQEVFVNELEEVSEGQLLAKIDPTDYENLLQEAKQNLVAANASLQATLFYFTRMKILYEQKVISQQEYVEAKAKYLEALALRKAAKAKVKINQDNLQYTQILAPTNGGVAKRSISKGSLVNAGEPLFGFVEGKQRWVIANLKETDLYHIRVGMKAKVKIDALHNKKFTGKIERIGQATGATFALLPPDNATGNFVKVVQRVPVWVSLAGLSDYECKQLQAGLSCKLIINYRQ